MTSKKFGLINGVRGQGKAPPDRHILSKTLISREDVAEVSKLLPRLRSLVVYGGYSGRNAFMALQIALSKRASSLKKLEIEVPLYLLEEPPNASFPKLLAGCQTPEDITIIPRKSQARRGWCGDEESIRKVKAIIRDLTNLPSLKRLKVGEWSLSTDQETVDVTDEVLHLLHHASKLESLALPTMMQADFFQICDNLRHNQILRTLDLLPLDRQLQASASSEANSNQQKKVLHPYAYLAQVLETCNTTLTKYESTMYMIANAAENDPQEKWREVISYYTILNKLGRGQTRRPLRAMIPSLTTIMAGPNHRETGQDRCSMDTFQVRFAYGLLRENPTQWCS